jgi:hypothetical protein
MVAERPGRASSGVGMRSFAEPNSAITFLRMREMVIVTCSTA